MQSIKSNSQANASNSEFNNAANKESDADKKNNNKDVKNQSGLFGSITNLLWKKSSKNQALLPDDKDPSVSIICYCHFLFTS